MKSILLIFLSTLLGFSSGHVCQKLVPPTAATAEMFPYHAVVRTNLHAPNKSQQIWCNGALISHNFVLVRGTCVVGQNISLIYLGFNSNPFYSKNRKNDLAGQVFTSERIYIHEHFGYLQKSKRAILYNVGLVLLDEDIVPSKTVRPIAIASPSDYPILPGTFINQTGYKYIRDDSPLRYATVEENNIELCNMLYDNPLLPVQEKCVRQEGTERNGWVGPYVANGVLIGIQRSLLTNTKCQASTPPCSINDIYISLESTLSWIYKISGVAGHSGKEHFQSCNPYWDNRATQSSHGQQCRPPQTIDPNETHKPTGNKFDFSDAIRKGIDKGVKRLLCKKKH